MPSSGSGEAALAPPGDEANEIDDPVAVRAQHEMIGAGGGDRAGDRGTLRGCGGRIALAQLPIMSVDVTAPACLGVGDLKQADVRERELARVDDFDRDDVVTVCERLQLALPSAGSEEVGEHDDEASTGREPTTSPQRLTQPGVVRTVVHRGLAERGEHRRDVRMRVDRAGKTARVDAVVDAPTRLPPRLASSANAPAAAHTTSRFSDRAVPKSRLFEASTTSHSSSSRSAMVSRTCGSVVRAVTAQSMCRVSSPAT